MFKIHWYHRNLKCQGFTINGFYFDISFPFMEGWGWKWSELVRIYWRRHYLFLPSFRHICKDNASFVIQCSDGYEWFDHDESRTAMESHKVWEEIVETIDKGEFLPVRMRMIHKGRIVREWRDDRPRSQNVPS